MNNHLLIPVDFCAHALSTNKETTHHLYLLLKCRLPGYGYLPNSEICDLSGYLDRKERTVRKHLKTLTEWNYIGHDSQKDLYFIRSWKRIRQIIGLPFKTGVSVDLSYIKDPQAFFGGAVIGRLAKAKESKIKEAGREPAQLIRCGKRAYPGSTSGLFISIADRALASILNISKTKANNLKHEAHRKGYIFLKHRYKPFIQDDQQLRICQTEKQLLRESFSEYADRLRVDRQGRVSLQCSDLVASKLYYKKGRNF